MNCKCGAVEPEICMVCNLPTGGLVTRVEYKALQKRLVGAEQQIAELNQALRKLYRTFDALRGF